MVFKRCTAVTLSDEVFQALVKTILSGEVEPGARLDVVEAGHVQCQHRCTDEGVHRPDKGRTPPNFPGDSSRDEGSRRAGRAFPLVRRDRLSHHRDMSQGCDPPWEDRL